MSNDQVRLYEPADDHETDGLAEVNGPDEAERIAAVLRGLLGTVSNPVARACLEEALEDVLHLTGGDGSGRDDAAA